MWRRATGLKAAAGRRTAVYYVRRDHYARSTTSATANGVVRTAFLLGSAALVGLAVAMLLGIALSSRLAAPPAPATGSASRSLDEHELGTLGRAGGAPSPTEIDELAYGVRDDARAAAPAGGRAPRVRRHGVARAAHAARLARGHARVAGRRPRDAEPIDVDDARERVASAQVQSRRLRGASRSDLLDLSRDRRAASKLRSEPVELVETARAVTAEFDRPRPASARWRSSSTEVNGASSRGRRPTPGASRGSSGSCSTTRCTSRRPAR